MAMSWVVLLVLLTTIGCVLAVLYGDAGRRHDERTERLRVLEEALNQPGLDEETRRQLLRTIASGSSGWLRNPQVWARLSFGIGWVLFIIAGGFLLLYMLDIIRRIDEDLVFGLALLGLAMLSLPLGLREFIRRDRKLADEG